MSLINISKNTGELLLTHIGRYLHDYRAHTSLERSFGYTDIHHLWLISLAIEFFEGKEQRDCFHQGSLILKNIKTFVEESTNNWSGFFDGLAEISFIVNHFCKTTGCYEKFSSAIYSHFLMTSNLYVDFCFKNANELRFFHYDTVSGLSGIGYYILLNYKKTDIEDALLRKIIDYMCQLIEVGSNNLPNWHIKAKNQATTEDVLYFPLGHLNFSMSHGITGPLSFLTAAYNAGFKDSHLINSLQIFLNTIESHAQIVGDLAYWPTKVSPADYILGKCGSVENYSWCYGMPSILRICESANKAQKNQRKAKEISKLFDILMERSQRIVFPGDSSNIVCHGYTGLICTLLSHQTECPSLINEKRILDLYNRVIQSGTFFYNSSGRNTFLEGIVGELIVLLSIYKNDISAIQHLMLV